METPFFLILTHDSGTSEEQSGARLLEKTVLPGVDDAGPALKEILQRLFTLAYSARFSNIIRESARGITHISPSLKQNILPAR